MFFSDLYLDLILVLVFFSFLSFIVSFRWCSVVAEGLSFLYGAEVSTGPARQCRSLGLARRKRSVVLIMFKALLEDDEKEQW